jgi:hypothetical protein
MINSTQLSKILNDKEVIMRKFSIVSTFILIGFFIGINSGICAPVGPSGGLDVNVVNTDEKPVPVSAQQKIEIEKITGQVNISSEEEVQRVLEDVYVVPEGKIFSLEYVSFFLDVALVAVVQGAELEKVVAHVGNFVVGPMEMIEFSTRGTPNFFIGKAVPILFFPGETVRIIVSPHFTGINFTFGRLDYALSGRLIPE